MSPDEIHEQARQFVQHRSKQPGSFDTDFSEWEHSKDLDAWDAARIRVVALELTAANEGTVATDSGDEITRHLP